MLDHRRRNRDSISLKKIEFANKLLLHFSKRPIRNIRIKNYTNRIGLCFIYILRIGGTLFRNLTGDRWYRQFRNEDGIVEKVLN